MKPAVQPKERPVLFNGAMVRAILDGRKTQTRRVVKRNASGRAQKQGKQWHIEDPNAVLACPYGQPGDRLWVRETWQGPLISSAEMDADPTWAKDLSRYQDSAHCAYRASGDSCEFFDAHEDAMVERWRPSIHMPRWASRILLEVVSVRVERLNQISNEDAEAEGARALSFPNVDDLHTDRDRFRALWNRINGAESWDANPWVWVVEFQIITRGES